MDSKFSAWSEWGKKDFGINRARASAMLYIFKMADQRVLKKVESLIMT